MSQPSGFVSVRGCRRAARRYAACIALLSLSFCVAGDSLGPKERQADFRYAPSDWQTCIGLPDDWQKTLVGKDGALLYDYPGPRSGFRLKVLGSLDEGSQWIGQELASPRIPIVRTFRRSPSLEVLEEAFALPPEATPLAARTRTEAAVERQGEQTGMANWASPLIPCDPSFRNVAVGWAKPIQYRVKVDRRKQYGVAFGLCEGWHTNAAERVLELKVEGKTVRTVDMVREAGRNLPRVFPFVVQDENVDGWLDLEVSASAQSRDKNTILNLFWVLEGGALPEADELVRGNVARPALVRQDGSVPTASSQKPRYDAVIATYRNTSFAPVEASPVVRVETDAEVKSSENGEQVHLGALTTLFASQPVIGLERKRELTLLKLAPRTLAPGEEYRVIWVVGRGVSVPRLGLQNSAELRSAAARFWQRVDLPYDAIQVPDPAIQSLLDSSLRNIYQAREIKKGLPAFQVGPTCYRGLWVVDGSFLMESVAFVGRAEEARRGIQYLLSFQREDGAFMLMDKHWKETGIVLWAVARHAKLTGDKAWLRSVWPKVEKAFGYVRTMRAMTDPKAPNYRLIPAGFSDGGLGEVVCEYTNPYWTMAGLRAAVEAARWLGRNDQAAEWDREYQDFLQTYRAAADRDRKTDTAGNSYVPIRMERMEGIRPQRAQWAFCHAVFPGQVFAADDPIVQGNMKMLEETEREGMVWGTGWIADGLWNYFASFYGHAWLWLGRGSKAADSLYAFANHASPLLCWREEQMRKGGGSNVVGDMPHNWASAEFIRLVRHMLVLERGTELHLCEGLPMEWLVPGKTLRLKNIQTEFGPIRFSISVNEIGTQAVVRLNALKRTVPSRIVLHRAGWGTEADVLEMPLGKDVKVVVSLKPRSS